MQERLGRDPFEALGLNSSDPGEVRTAFLALTKIYHPARFARMATEIQRLSNEVFLSMRAAHDSLTRAQVKPPAPRATGMIPIVRPPPAAPARQPSGSMPVLRPTPTPPGTRPTTPTAPGRTMTPPLGNPIQPRPHNPQSSATQPTQPMRPIAPAQRPSQPSLQQQQQPTQPMRPVGNPDPARPPSRLPSSSPPPTITAGSGRFAATPARPSGPAPVVSAGDAELAAILELLSQDRLTDARMKLHTLVTNQPGIPKYQALIHYAKGREAQLAGRRDEARLELLDALDLDRDLQMANTALSELLSRRK